MAEDAKQAAPAVGEQKAVEAPPTETSDVAAPPTTLAEFADTTNATEPQKTKEEKPADNSTKTSRR